MNSFNRSSHPLSQSIHEPMIMQTQAEAFNEDHEDAIKDGSENEPLSQESAVPSQTSQTTKSSFSNFSVRSSSTTSCFTLSSQVSASMTLSQPSDMQSTFSNDSTIRYSFETALEDPVSLKLVEYAARDLVQDLVPVDRDLFSMVQNYLPEFSKKYSDDSILFNHIKENLETIANAAWKDLISGTDTVVIEEILRQFDVIKRDPERLQLLLNRVKSSPESRLMEGLAHRRSTDSDTEPSVDAVKQVASAIRDAEKKMGVLKKEEEILMQGVVERTKELQALIAHSETLVDAAEDVADAIHPVDKEASLAQIILRDLLRAEEEEEGSTVKQAVFFTTERET